MDWDTFLNLVEKCKEETRFSSLLHYTLINKNFNEIEKEKKDILPFVFRLYRESDDNYEHICHLLLTSILKFNPIKEENFGRMVKMKEDWLEWADYNNY